MVTAKNISKTYGDLKVLKSVSLTVQPKEILAIVGPSGAGKTTLLQILGTLENYDSAPAANLLLMGKSVGAMKSKELAQFRNRHLGFIFQFHELLPEFSALENVCLPAWIGKKDTEATRKRAKSLLDLMGLKDRMQHKPTALSGGEQQRVAVARALMNAPELIFADEPSGNLDSENAAQLHELFLKIRKEVGCAFVIVTHNTELATMADRKITLVDGAIAS
ncbi:MAG: ABC transporter ATP-binding protein [Flavobacteriaceae bacterium]